MRTYRLVAPSLFELVEADPPRPRDLVQDEVLITMHAGGICGSDLPHFAGRRSVALDGDEQTLAAGIPGFPMHEIAGEITASSSPNFAVGDRVVGWAAGLTGLAETVRTTADGLAGYPSRWRPTEAIMVQPLACAIHALDQIGDVTGKRVAVLGLGPIGLLLAHMAKSRGASWVTGVDRVSRAGSAGLFGVDEFIHSSTDRWAHTLQDSARPEVVIEAIGHQVGTLVDGVRAVAPHGLVYYFGLPDDAVYPLPMNLTLRKNLTIRAGTVTPPKRRSVLARAVSHLNTNPDLVGAYVTDVFCYTDAQSAYIHASTPKEGQHKVVIEMDTMVPSSPTSTSTT